MYHVDAVRYDAASSLFIRAEFGRCALVGVEVEWYL